jgi:hypothetical protein
VRSTGRLCSTNDCVPPLYHARLPVISPPLARHQPRLLPLSVPCRRLVRRVGQEEGPRADGDRASPRLLLPRCLPPSCASSLSASTRSAASLHHPSHRRCSTVAPCSRTRPGVTSLCPVFLSLTHVVPSAACRCPLLCAVLPCLPAASLPLLCCCRLPALRSPSCLCCAHRFPPCRRLIAPRSCCRPSFPPLAYPSPLCPDSVRRPCGCCRLRRRCRRPLCLRVHTPLSLARLRLYVSCTSLLPLLAVQPQCRR